MLTFLASLCLFLGENLNRVKKLTAEQRRCVLFITLLFKDEISFLVALFNF